MNDTTDPARPAPQASLPLTGHRAIDEALASLELDADVHAHHDQLAATLEVIQEALNPRDQQPLPRP